MEIDKTVIKALAAERRVEILKSLAKRRKMPSELSKELGLATSTVIEHLHILENAELIERKETGRKWVYYELTFKGESLIKPKIPVQFIITLCLGIIFVFSSIVRYFTTTEKFAGQATRAPTLIVPTSLPAAGAVAENVNITNNITQIPIVQSSPDYIVPLILVVGIFLILISVFKIVTKKNKTQTFAL